MDDHVEIAESLSLIYGSKRNVEIVRTASNSEQLWKILSESEVDFVSLDVQLGKEDGIQICKLLHEKYPDIFIVMCTVESTEENKRLAQKVGASHFLEKPISMEDVTETLVIFSNRKKETSLTQQYVDELLNLLL